MSYDAASRRVTARDAGSVRTHDESIFSYLERELASLACAADGRSVRPHRRLRRLLRLRGQGGLRIAAAPPLAVAGRAVHPVRSADRLRPPRGPHLCRLPRAPRGRRPPLDGADGARAERARAASRRVRLGRPRRSSSRPGASARATSTTSPRASARSPPGRATRSASRTSSAAAPEVDPLTRVPRAAPAQSGAARRLPAVRRHEHPQLVARALPAHRPRRLDRGEADQGHRSAGRHRGGGSPDPRHAGDQREDAGREPHDRRSAAQRPRRRERARQRLGAEADGRRDVPDPPPAGLHGPRSPPRRTSRRSSASAPPSRPGR